MERSNLEVGTIHHIILRGTRGMDIFPEDEDKWKFVLLLYYQNDLSRPDINWGRQLSDMGPFERPSGWSERDPLALIHAYCILDNHVHLICEEIREGGISLFMSRLGKSMTHRFNKKYGGVGSIFQGPYKLRLITTDSDLLNVFLYVTVKNVSERYPFGGMKAAYKNFEGFFKWACEDDFSCFPDYGAGRKSPILDKNSILSEMFDKNNTFKKAVKEYLNYYIEKKQIKDIEEIEKDLE